jgi:transcriptional regulator with XRE-family HTH domain
MGKNRSKVSDQIRAAIETSGVSRYGIAMATGIDQATLSRFMGGTGGMTVETLDKLAEYLGLRIVFDGKPKDGSK